MTTPAAADHGLATRVPPSVWRWLKLAAFVGVTAALVVTLRGIDWRKVTLALGEARPGWLVLGVLANAAILPCWSLFWKALRPRSERDVGFARMLEITSISSSLMNTLPFGGGHASSVVLLVKRGGMTQRGALSILALDQLGEGLLKVIVLAGASLVIPLPSWMRAALTTVLLVVGAWLLTLVVVSRLTSELEVLKSVSRSSSALGCVAAMKLVELIAIVAVQAAYGVHISPAGSLLVLATAILATMLPVSPGNVGTYEASVFLAYKYLGVSPELALGLAVVQHVCFMIPAVGVGYVFFSNSLGWRAILRRSAPQDDTRGKLRASGRRASRGGFRVAKRDRFSVDRQVCVDDIPPIVRRGRGSVVIRDGLQSCWLGDQRSDIVDKLDVRPREESFATMLDQLGDAGRAHRDHGYPRATRLERGDTKRFAHGR
jgi:uncharacterized membrane protein YbhN (UPF0104 family)